MATAQRLEALFRGDRERIEAKGRVAGSALRVHDALKARPLTSLNELCKRTGRSFPTASSAIDVLEKLDIAQETTGRKRSRIFTYREYLAILSEGKEAR